MGHKYTARHIINAGIVMFFVLCVIAPILSMFSRITLAGFREVTASAQFAAAVWNSVSSALVATAVSLLLAMSAAWCIHRTAANGKAFFSMVFTVPMLIPSISHAFGLVALFGENGVLTNWLHLDNSIYGFWGIVVGAVLYSFPVAFLMFSNTFQYEDGMPYVAADVLGVPLHRQFRDITLPYLKKTIISAFFAVFTMVVTDYGVPLMIGGRTVTLSVLMYNKAVGMIDYDSGSVIGAILLIPAAAAFLVDLFNPERGQSNFVSEPVEVEKNICRDVISYVICTTLCACILAPVVSFGVMIFETKYPIDSTFTFCHLQETVSRGAGTYAFHSIIYSFMTAAIGTFFAFLCSYMAVRVRGKFNNALHLFSITSMAVPGMVLGLSYVIFFHDSPIYGTFLIVILVNIIHFFASPYLMMYNALGKLNPDLEAAGLSLGVHRFFMVRDVVLPKVGHTVLEMFSYFFVNAMMTISAVSFLAPPAPKPVSLMINQFEAQRLMESAAVVSMGILIINVGMKVLVMACEHLPQKRSSDF